MWITGRLRCHDERHDDVSGREQDGEPRGDGWTGDGLTSGAGDGGASGGGAYTSRLIEAMRK